jgi:hypothetical protein
MTNRYVLVIRIRLHAIRSVRDIPLLLNRSGFPTRPWPD